MLLHFALCSTNAVLIHTTTDTHHIVPLLCCTDANVCYVSYIVIYNSKAVLLIRYKYAAEIFINKVITYINIY